MVANVTKNVLKRTEKLKNKIRVDIQEHIKVDLHNQ